uniref:Uncharacterized protein n=1 Tax=Arundo donax TaxID=35708 RepID=A0A0A8YCG5_ARUDO
MPSTGKVLDNIQRNWNNNVGFSVRTSKQCQASQLKELPPSPHGDAFMFPME